VVTDATVVVTAALFGLDGFEMLAAADAGGELEFMIEATADLVGCPGCGELATAKDRRPTWVGNLPIAGRAVVLWGQADLDLQTLAVRGQDLDRDQRGDRAAGVAHHAGGRGRGRRRPGWVTVAGRALRSLQQPVPAPVNAAHRNPTELSHAPVNSRLPIHPGPRQRSNSASQTLRRSLCRHTANGASPQPDEACPRRLPVLGQARAGTRGQTGRPPPPATPRRVDHDAKRVSAGQSPFPLRAARSGLKMGGGCPLTPLSP